VATRASSLLPGHAASILAHLLSRNSNLRLGLRMLFVQAPTSEPVQDLFGGETHVESTDQV